MTAMASSGTAVVSLPADDQILITREFDAPRHLVFKAWTTPELVKRWWSGKRGGVTLAEIDLREGGAWRYVMNAHGGGEVAFHGEYREIVPNERLVFSWGAAGGWPPLDPEQPDDSPLVTVTMDRSEGGTELTVNVVIPPTVSAESMPEGWFGHIRNGWQDTVDRLASSLAGAPAR